MDLKLQNPRDTAPLSCEFTETWDVTQRDIKAKRSYQIALKRGNQNPQNNMIASFSFASTAHVTQWSNYLIISTDWDFDSTIKFNASTGEDYFEWFVSGVCGTDVAFDLKQVGFTVSSLFFPRPASCSRQFTPNGSNFVQHFTAAEYSRTWSISWHLHK